MITIWKYPLEPSPTQVVNMPEGAKILTAQMQRESICLWAMVDTEKEPEERVIEVIGTGHPISPGFERVYIDTVQMRGGQYIYHVFEFIG